MAQVKLEAMPNLLNALKLKLVPQSVQHSWQQSGLVFLWLAIVTIVFAQITKIWVSSELALYQPVEFLPFWQWTHARNPGAAFSFLSDAGGWQRWLFTVLALGVSFAFSIWLRRLTKQEWKLNAALALIIGGAIGNLIDRLAYGYVIDFIDVFYANYHFPAFNIADSAITVGAALLLLDSFIRKDDTKID